MSRCCGINASASACFSVNSKEYGFTSVPFQFNETTTATLWEATNLPGLSGTVVIIGNMIAGTTRITINGMNSIQLFNNETIAISANPLNCVTLTYITAKGELSSISASISAVRYEY